MYQSDRIRNCDKDKKILNIEYYATLKHLPIDFDKKNFADRKESIHYTKTALENMFATFQNALYNNLCKHPKLASKSTRSLYTPVHKTALSQKHEKNAPTFFLSRKFNRNFYNEQTSPQHNGRTRTEANVSASEMAYLF